MRVHVSWWWWICLGVCVCVAVKQQEMAKIDDCGEGGVTSMETNTHGSSFQLTHLTALVTEKSISR